MSVINQMLKDLEQRQSEQVDGASIVAPMVSNNSPRKLIAFISVALVVIMLTLIFAWQLYSENKQFKAELQRQTVTNAAQKIPHKVAVDNNNNSLESVQRQSVSTVKSPLIAEDSADFPIELSNKTSELTNHNAGSNLTQANQINHSASEQAPTTEPSIVRLRAESRPTLAENAHEPEQKTLPAPSLTISRTQLSPQALAENKISQAEQAMERNDLAKAEALFEEVLLVVPEHETARKQLAALWYGKKYYQDAINLLSQGIALAPQAQEMRLMSARIYYEQGLAREAFNILSPVQHSISTEIQALLASTAAELNEHDNAINAYRKLIDLEPDVGRWWLGLAVSLDSTAQFMLARDAYKQAIASNNLSTAAVQFTRQRLIELGE